MKPFDCNYSKVNKLKSIPARRNQLQVMTKEKEENREILLITIKQSQSTRKK